MATTTLAIGTNVTVNTHPNSRYNGRKGRIVDAQESGAHVVVTLPDSDGSTYLSSFWFGWAELAEVA